ncbi:MAG: hypothetical protein DMG11_23380 [Acidobacteria bacterium]|nr:MAG: hypothetical protein DMG11_23380 [Acidobacteriota bacterium]
MHPQIAAFARLATENTPPLRTLQGQKTLISRTMHAFGYDPIHDEIVVNSPLAQAILIFRGGANGEEAPIRVIQGPHTRIIGTATGANSKVNVDPEHNEILLPTGDGSAPGEPGTVASAILTFARDANGDVPPKRILSGPDTQIVGTPAVAADLIRNLLVVNVNNAFLIFDRTAEGNTKPKAIIRGPKSQVASMDNFVISPTGMIVNLCTGGAICAWSINDNGDVPPRWKIPMKQITGYRVSGVALVPAHKEIIFSAGGWGKGDYPPSGIMNAVITFSWPELFD